MLNEKEAQSLREMKEEILDELKTIKRNAEKDLEIDEVDLDSAVLKTPNILSKYNELFTDQTMILKDLYSLKERVKLERWKYWAGRQSDKYYTEHGLIHEKILKSDIDRYLSADEKILLVNDVITVQKALVDYLERCIKEIQTRNFHARVCVDWRKFSSGA